MRILGVATLITMCFALIGTAHAETPFGSLRVFVASADPTSDFAGDIGLGSPVGVEADSSTGFGVVYEIRINQRLGVETGMAVVPFDFGLEFLGSSEELGDTTAILIAIRVPSDAGVKFGSGLVSWGAICRLSSVSRGILRRITFPSLLGVRPRSDTRMARSMSFKVLASNGRMSRTRASGTLMVASCTNGV